MNWLSSLFNTTIARERVKAVAMELLQQDRDHSYSCDNSALKHVDGLHRLVNDPSSNYGMIKEKGFSFQKAANYLYKKEILTLHHCTLLYTLVQKKRFKETRIYNYFHSAHMN